MFSFELFNLLLSKYKDSVQNCLLSLTFINNEYHSGFYCRSVDSARFEEEFVSFDDLPVLTDDNLCYMCRKNLTVKILDEDDKVDDEENNYWNLKSLLKLIDYNETVKKVLSSGVETLDYEDFKNHVALLNFVWRVDFYFSEKHPLFDVLKEDSVLVKEVKKTFTLVKEIASKKLSDSVFIADFFNDCVEASVSKIIVKESIVNDSVAFLIDEVFNESKKLFVEALKSSKDWVLTNYGPSGSYLSDMTSFLFRQNVESNNFFMVPLPVFEETCAVNHNFWQGNVTLKEKLSDEDLEMFQVLVNDQITVETDDGLTSKELSSLIEVVLHV